MLANVERMTPLGRIGDPTEVGGLAAFLATPAGSFISAETIVVDGGMSISQGT
jgi:NAD(P)-dependent dehydrogenase (short-subunit alcohol dehydrogenase family)